MASSFTPELKKETASRGKLLIWASREGGAWDLV